MILYVLVVNEFSSLRGSIRICPVLYCHLKNQIINIINYVHDKVHICSTYENSKFRTSDIVLIYDAVSGDPTLQNVLHHAGVTCCRYIGTLSTRGTVVI